MSLYRPEVVTIWIIRTSSEVALDSLFAFTYTEDGEPQRSRFAKAFRLDWYDEDFAELHVGGTARELLIAASDTCRTLDEQALPRLPEGEWNAVYLLYGAAGEEWQRPDSRPPMPDQLVDVDGVTVKLLDSFHVLMRG